MAIHRFRAKVAIVLFALALLLVGRLGWAGPVEEAERAALISAGQIATARSQLEATQPTTADRIFFDGQVRKARGQHKSAISLFRQMLRIRPNHLNARRELAHTLLLSDNFEAAELSFRDLLRMDPNPRMRAGYRDFIDEIHRHQPVTVRTHLAVLPSTNVNRGSAARSFDTEIGRFVIDPASRARTGLGIETGIGGHVRHQNAPGQLSMLSWGLEGTVYGDSIQNTLTAHAALSYSLTKGSSTWTIAPYFRRIWRRDHTGNVAVGMGVSFGQMLRPGVTLLVSGSREYRTYPRLDGYDGRYSSLGGELIWQPSPSLTIRGGLEIGQSALDRAFLSHRSISLTAEATKRWQGGLETGIGVEFGEGRFDADYPLMGQPRSDHLRALSLTIGHDAVRIWGGSPRLTCTIRRDRSNIGLFDQNTSECRATLSRAF
ncbi:porin family protein [Palleronia caenipelagi]|uniref:DUF560 domain-containing protein n=1 Tax=Palleronia caenipelagi TaxID=2489174 RepID=A0A547Q5U5_9RHOB|nr:porin family protein [Palleronia caenipelagi]TRD21727.1 DUF560 domain-containing protein [Palleronia caenipelagi]